MKYVEIETDESKRRIEKLERIVNKKPFDWSSTLYWIAAGIAAGTLIAWLI